MSDLPKNENEAWSKFQAQNPGSFDASTLGAERRMNEFLQNRLYKCFYAGIAAGRMLERERVMQRLAKLINE